MKDDIELTRAATLKAARSMVRLRHSLEADRELNDVLPRIERAFDALVAEGTLPNPTALLLEFVTGDE